MRCVCNASQPLSFGIAKNSSSVGEVDYNGGSNTVVDENQNERIGIDESLPKNTLNDSIDDEKKNTISKLIDSKCKHLE